MSDTNTPALAVGIVAVITALGSAAILVLKYIKHSKCSKCCEIDTRTPTDVAPPIILTAPPPSPQVSNKQVIKIEDTSKESIIV